MKIKEIVTATGLTDRAIRLYIEHGLLEPDIKENYSGRKSVEFSAEDVEKLKRISLLRRAGFSIPQIKALDVGGEEAEKALREFMDDKRRQHELDGKVLESLSVIDMESDVTLEGVAERLTDEMLEGAENEDLKPTGGKIWVSVVCVIISLISAFVSLYEIALASVAPYDKYRFPVIGTDKASYAIQYVFPVIALIIVGVLLFVRFKPQRKRTVRVTLTVVLTIALVINIILSPFFIILFSLGGAYDSRTDEPDNYLVFDNWVNRSVRDEIVKVFPASIPLSAYEYNIGTGHTEEFNDTSEYLYYINSNFFYYTLDIYAQWRVSSVVCENERLRIEETFPDAEWVEKGDFVCAYIPVSHESCAMFAYNLEDGVVRYGYYWYSIGTDLGTPYYETKDWEWTHDNDFEIEDFAKNYNANTKKYK